MDLESSFDIVFRIGTRVGYAFLCCCFVAAAYFSAAVAMDEYVREGRLSRLTYFTKIWAFGGGLSYFLGLVVGFNDTLTDGFGRGGSFMILFLFYAIPSFFGARTSLSNSIEAKAKFAAMVRRDCESAITEKQGDHVVEVTK